jgi:hypothetical protein
MTPFLGMLQSFNYQPEDMFWGQLAGCIESIDSGVTTVVDHANLTYSPAHGMSRIRKKFGLHSKNFFQPPKHSVQPHLPVYDPFFATE